MRIVERYYRLKRNNHPRGGDTLAVSRRKKETMMQTGDATLASRTLVQRQGHRYKRLYLDRRPPHVGKLETETGRPTTTDTHASVFSSNPQVYTRLKNAYYPRSSRIAGEKISGAGYGIYRGILPAYKAMSMNHWRCWNKIVRFVRGRERSVHYKYYDIDNRKEWLLLQRIKDRFDPGIFL